METGKNYVFRQLAIILVIGIFGLLVLAAGLMIGYAVLGEGKNPFDILKMETWQSIVSKFLGR